MFCTIKEQESCQVEKRGCKGCFYDSNKIIEAVRVLEENCKNNENCYSCYFYEDGSTNCSLYNLEMPCMWAEIRGKNRADEKENNVEVVNNE